MIKQCPKCRREYDTTNTLCPVDGTVLERIGDPLEGQVLADKYRIEERLSAGGMGAVYRATHVMMEKKVAVKVLHPALASDEQIVQRFTREARAASRISHPHALNVTDFGESENGVVFLVMEYLRGRTLKEVIREEGLLPLSRAVEIMRQVAGALDAAHAEGVVHRDLKSDNIMLEEIGGHQDWAKVLDFGIAKIQEPLGNPDPGLTAPNLVIGTPQYMSPEQCSQSSNIDKRSDIYSLGIILFEMLTGSVPFGGDSPTAIMMKQIQEAPPSVLELNAELPAGVDAVIRRALAKQPDDRYPSAGEFADALAQAAEGAAVTAGVGVGFDTNSVATSTASNERVRDTLAMDAADEATMVNAPRAPLTTPMHVPESAADPNLWRIMIPAALVLIGVIAVTYAFMGKSNPEDAGAAGGLRVDPNSQPAQAIVPTATGESERGVAPRAQSVPTAPANSGTSGGGSAETYAPGADAPAPFPMGGESPVVVLPVEEGVNENNAGDADAGNANANTEPTQTPTPATNRNTNQRRTPVSPPTIDAPANLGAPPPPIPSPSPRRRAPQAAPQESPAPPTAPPTAEDDSSI